jgi:hypothetical protein
VDRQHLLHILKEISNKNLVLGPEGAEDQNLNVPGVDHRSQGNNVEAGFGFS